MKYTVSDLDIFYISYDEPQAAIHYRDLCNRYERDVKHVHGIKGFAQAHKVCATLSTTPRFVTVDGDNMVMESLFCQEVNDDLGEDLVFSFKAKNIINGLEYGNGGVKIWPKALLSRVSTHEDSQDESASTDFCWAYRYMQVNHLASTVHCNGSPLQAFRAGYREGVKMALIGGRKLNSWEETRTQIWQGNLSRLLTWASVGMDVENGIWAIYGTRMGLADTWLEGQSIERIRDYDWFDDYFATVSNSDPLAGSRLMGWSLNQKLGLGIVDLDAEQSRWFKSVYMHPTRSGLMIPDMEPVKLDD